MIAPKVKDEGKVKKNSLYIRIIMRGKGPDVLFSSGRFVHMPDGKTPLSFSQDTFTFQAKCFGVSGKTLRRFKQNSSVFAVKCKGVSSQTPRRSENIRNYISPERFKAFF